MPFRGRKRKRSFKKRSFRKKFRGRRKRSSRPYGGVLKYSSKFAGGNLATQVPFPQVYITKLPYYKTANTIAGAAFTLTTFNVNALFDIDTLGGDVGFASAMSNLYRSYVVLGVAWTVTCVNLETDTSLNFGVVMWPSNQAPTDFQGLQFRPGCKTIMVDPIGSGKTQRTLRGYCDLRKLWGTKIGTEEEFWGTGTTDPTRLLRMYIGLSDNTGNTKNVQLRVHFQLYTKWFNRNLEGAPAALIGPLAPNRLVAIERMKFQLAELEASVPEVKEEEKMEEV